MGHSFFLSYAREDREGDPYEVVDRFYRDLVRAIGSRKALPAEQIGFRDTTNVQTGDRWPGAVEEALRTCRAFVPVLSARYLSRPYCGKEWTAFRQRLPGDRASLIQPVLLIPRDYVSGPSEVTDVADSDDSLPELYRNQGLEVLLRHRETQAYEQFITAFTTRLLQVIDDYPLAPADALPPLGEIPSAFHAGTGPALDLPQSGAEEGPRFAKVMLVAARPEELEDVRAAVDAYGAQGGLVWRPWHPDVQEHVSRMVGEVALQEGFLPSWVEAGDDVDAQIKEAFDLGNVVVIVVDPWSLRLESYSTCMRKVDASGYMNSIIAVVWNEHDAETSTAASQLLDGMRVAFANKYAFGDRTSFLERVTSPDDLRQRLSVALARTAARITEHREVLRRAGEQPA